MSMMLPEIVPLAALQDNYIWLLRSGNGVVCVDPGDAVPVVDYVRKYNLTLEQIWITHHHRDHTAGVTELKRLFPDCRVLGNRDIEQADDIVEEGHCIRWRDISIQVWQIAGHTAYHLAFFLEIDGILRAFVGDTLFSGGCGRVFDGTVVDLFASLQRLNMLPETTLFYPAHEYTEANLRFAAYIEPDNAEIQAALQAAKQTPTLPVSLQHERKINPFLRCQLPAIATRISECINTQLTDTQAVFEALRTLKNHF